MKFLAFLIALFCSQIYGAEEDAATTFDSLADPHIAQIASYLNGKSASKLAATNKRNRNAVINSYYPDSDTDEGFSTKQFSLIHRLKASLKESEGQPMSIQQLHMFRDIFKGTEKVTVYKQKMVKRLNMALLDFADEPAFFKAAYECDVYKVKVLVDYFGHNCARKWSTIRRIVKFVSVVRNISNYQSLALFYNNSLRLLDMQDNEDVTIDEFAAYYHSVRDMSSLNILDINEEQGDVEGRYLLNRFSGLSERQQAIFDFVLQQGSEFDPNSALFSSPDKLNRLIMALFFGGGDDFDVAKKLLFYPSVDINHQVKEAVEGWTPLIWAIRMKNFKAIDFLLKQPNIDVNAKDRKEYSPLMYAATYPEFLVLLVTLTRKPNIDVNARDSHGRTALIHATSKNDVDAMGYLLQVRKIDINVADFKNKDTALHYAVTERATNALKLLLKQPNINVEAKNAFGLTAFDCARKDRYIDGMRLISVKLGKPLQWWQELLHVLFN